MFDVHFIAMVFCFFFVVSSTSSVVSFPFLLPLHFGDFSSFSTFSGECNFLSLSHTLSLILYMCVQWSLIKEIYWAAYLIIILWMRRRKPKISKLLPLAFKWHWSMSCDQLNLFTTGNYHDYKFSTIFFSHVFPSFGINDFPKKKNNFEMR